MFATTPTDTGKLTPYIDFQNIGNQNAPPVGDRSYLLNGQTTPIVDYSVGGTKPSSNSGALWEGEIYLSHLGKYTFGTASDDGSALWLDPTNNSRLSPEPSRSSITTQLKVAPLKPAPTPTPPSACTPS